MGGPGPPYVLFLFFFPFVSPSSLFPFLRSFPVTLSLFLSFCLFPLFLSLAEGREVRDRKALL